MSGWEAVAVAIAGLLAGAINAAVGSGTLITFPTLLMVGFPPVVANVSSGLGLVPGSVAGAWSYRREIRPVAGTVRRLVPVSACGAVLGALLLLRLPAGVFDAAVPVLIVVALVLVIAGPRLGSRMGSASLGPLPSRRWALIVVGVLATAVYGGYFGAAQGVLLVGLLGPLVPWELQQINGVKNALSGVVNLLAALTFVLIDPAQVSWLAVTLVGAGSAVGGMLGGNVARRLSPWVLRGVIVAVGLLALVAFAAR
jgi:uncharacterized membrane protein YfcA